MCRRLLNRLSVQGLVFVTILQENVNVSMVIGVQPVKEPVVLMTVVVMVYV